MTTSQKNMRTLLRRLFLNILNRFSQRHAKKKNYAISLLPNFKGITLIDIGAAGDIEPRWKAVEQNLNYIGFEPDKRSRALLQKKKNSCREYSLYPYAVWENDGNIDFNLCKKPEVSSAFEPNLPFTNLFPDARRFDIVKNFEIQSERLDNINIDNPDFMKLDIQGGELNALRGGDSTLCNLFGLEIEVEFLPIYINQPLFGDIAKFLSSYNFEFIDFVNLCRWERGAHQGYGQCVFGDALFLKTPELIMQEKLSDQRISSYLAILFLYKRFDLIDKMFEYFTPSQKIAFNDFKIALKPLHKSHIIARNISYISDKVIRAVESDTRNWLLY